jgi:hypothetical protein
VHEDVYNQGSPTTLLSEFQLQEHDCIVDSISTKHPTSVPDRNGGQCFLPRPQHVYISFIINGGLMTFRHRLPTEQELASLTPFDITADSNWDPSSHYSDPCLLLMAKAIYRYPLRRHDIKSCFPQANRPRLKEKVATDTVFANCRDITGATCAQVSNNSTVCI